MVDRKVDEADARLALEEIRREMSAEAAKTRTECVSDEYGRRLEASCSALGRRMAAAEAAIATKVDESLVSGLEATCERLRVADAQVMACAQRQDTCEAALVACAKAQDEERDSREALAAATKADLEHLEGIDKNHAETLAAAFSHLTRSDATTHAALERIDALDRTAERIVLRCDQTEDLCRGLVSETRADLANNSRSLQRAIDRADDTAFARDAVNAASSRDDLRLFVRRLKADHIDDIRLKIAAIQAAQNTMSHSLDVALKFVDWFANRGHAYEHNLNAIDRTLASMVLADRAKCPSAREPCASLLVSFLQSRFSVLCAATVRSALRLRWMPTSTEFVVHS